MLALGDFMRNLQQKVGLGMIKTFQFFGLEKSFELDRDVTVGKSAGYSL